MKTIKELEQYLEENCYSFTELTIGKHHAHEWDRAHIVAATFDQGEITMAEDYLNKKGIRFERNDIPNFIEGKDAYRIFVFGTDIKLLEDFKNKYLHYLR